LCRSWKGGSLAFQCQLRVLVLRMNSSATILLRSYTTASGWLPSSLMSRFMVSLFSVSIC
jgi:hypothetical protein